MLRMVHPMVHENSSYMYVASFQIRCLVEAIESMVLLISLIRSTPYYIVSDIRMQVHVFHFDTKAIKAIFSQFYSGYVLQGVWL